jgi:pantoate--beta-alanine ligase
VKIVHSIAELRDWRRHTGGASLGFVATMGALHPGHESLIKRSVAECDMTVVSIYVNPTQFDHADDLTSYPRTLEQDSLIAESFGADLVFAPAYQDIYPDDFRYQVHENEFSRELCGAHCDGHFTGVLTVVMKLLNLVKPDRAFFGEKDYQQYKLISDMVAAFFLDVEIVPCETVREADGLALSSRNLNLDCESRRLAPVIHRLIESDLSDEEVACALAEQGFTVDYVISKYERRFVAARTGAGEKEIRLIDNVPRVSAGAVD